MASPYPIARTEKRVTVLGEEGFEVVATNSLDIERSRVSAELHPDLVARHAIDLALANPDGDVIYMPCGSLPAASVPDRTESATGRPVITWVQAQGNAPLCRAGDEQSSMA